MIPNVCQPHVVYSVFESSEDIAAQEKQMALACQMAQSRNLVLISLKIPVFIIFLLQERKIRREIANSNERRRMQSINAGLQSLRTLLPQHEGEKLSKVI